MDLSPVPSETAGPTARRRWSRATVRWVAGSMTVIALACLVVAVLWQPGGEDSSDPAMPASTVETTVPTAADTLPEVPEDWNVGDPLPDLAQIHASSRLRYDECQQDFRDITDQSGGNHFPFYFC